MSRPLQVSLLGGSLASVAWRILEEGFQHAAPGLFECPDCPALHFLPPVVQLDVPSLAIGVCIGLVVGPLIDLLYLLRVWWSAFVRERFRIGRATPAPLYRVLS